MNGRSDASTSTDDVKSRPLCLFYFTHPFGVLSPEPPTVARAPPHITRAFLNMQPVAPFDLWSPSTDPSYNTTTSPSAPSRPAYDLGKVTVHRNPVTLSPHPDRTVHLSRRDSISSSLFSSDIWFNSGSSSRSNEYSRRVIPYNRILPPLQLPPTISDLDDSDEYWPKKRLNPEKFSLPPIELPALREEVVSSEEMTPLSETRRSRAGRGAGCGARRGEGVLKPRRRRRLDARRVLACLMRRAVRGGGSESNPSPALREVLRVIREAWTEPASLFDRTAAVSVWCGTERHVTRAAMLPRDASPGLLTRRYSVPETIMRKYKMSQQRADCEESVPGSAGSASAGSGGRTRAAPRDRELMRKSALLRRMWGRAVPAPCSPSPASPAPCCRCCCDHARPSRSLDGSRADLRPRLSASTYRSHAARGLSTDTDRPPSLFDDQTSEAVTVEIESASELPPAYERSSLSERVPRISSSSSTCRSVDQDTEVQPSSPPSDDHSTLSVSNENTLLLSTNPLVTVETPSPSSCETLEIVVTETAEPGVTTSPRLPTPRPLPRPAPRQVVARHDIDRYVSDVLVESLNSLSDRLEYVTSSVDGEGKISVIEKEIKVKLHSTGVNTIVHLSPTSNNQIIFGNEELCDGTDRDRCNNPRGSLSIRDEPPDQDEQNNNPAASPSPAPSPSPAATPGPLSLPAPAHTRHRGHTFEQLLQHNNVNIAVLQQIQKLFNEELQSLDPEHNYTDNVKSGISHIEISNVDVFLHESEPPTAEIVDLREGGGGPEVEELSAVGTGSYFETSEGVVVVPRFSALPHTDSMEVNTSSSEEADAIGSDCTSLVDSLDDPNSPRSVYLRRSFNNRKTELVRSAIDVLDLLPENNQPDRDDVNKDKPESFFIRIRDDNCECDKENFNVADRMPEKIKERLIRRHRRRQLRMECARRSRGKQQRAELYRTKREIERDCVAIINSLIDEVIAKIAKDEFKCARIKRKCDRPAPSKADENSSRKNRKKNTRPPDRTPSIPAKRSPEIVPAVSDDHPVDEKHQVRGKLSIMTRPPLNLTEPAPRRVYQKSEILEGNKCIEILEILEYVNETQSSPSTPVSDDSPGGGGGRAGRRSRIPVPVTEKNQRSQPPAFRHTCSSAENSPASPHDAPAENPPPREKRRASEGDISTGAASPTSRRVFFPPSVDSSSRPRSDSLRFRRVFDMIPEERSSVSVESSDAERATPARTRSVATSPLPATAAAPLRVKGGDVPRRARVWAPLGRREEGKREKDDKKISSRSEPLPPAPTLTNTAYKRDNKTKTGKKASLSKLRDRAKPPPPSPPEVTRHLDDTTDQQSSVDDRKPLDQVATKSEEESVGGVEAGSGVGREEGGSSSEGSDGGGGLLCSRWRGGTHRRRRTQHTAQREKGWSVTVAGSCVEALPADLEMRLRFPQPPSTTHHHRSNQPTNHQCTCRSCVGCTCTARDSTAASSPAPLPAAAPHPRRRLSHPDTRLTLTMKKEARDSSILASKSMRKSMDPLPELETFRSSRSKVKSSVKTRRGYSLHCWLPDDEPAPVRASNGLSVLGCAIIPELKPRVPTMSERDLTRLYTPRNYLRL